MTNVITRYFDSATQAKAVRRELIDYQRLPRRIVDLYESADGLSEKLTAFDVLPETARAYEAKLAKGGAVLLVLAQATPLGVARITRDVTAQMGAADMGNVIEEVYVKDPPGQPGKILEGHPHILTRRLDADRTSFHMADWPLPLTNRRKPFTASILSNPHARMANFPIGLISRRKPFTGSIFARHARMANFPIPLISKRKPFDKFAFPRHKRMANFPLPLISKRKPYTGSIIARHARMANWPFPHLINGKQGANSLMPGGPRMANFPISLISKRKPFDGFAFPRHMRMANFPLPLISKRKPYDGFAIPRHGRMADAILPLVIKHGEDSKGEAGSGFSLSKMLGLPTISRR